MADTTPADVFLNKAIRTAWDAGRSVNSAMQSVPDYILNPLLSYASTSAAPIALGTFGAKAFFDNPVASAEANALAPKSTQIGTSRRNSKNEVELYAGDDYGWQSVPSYTKLFPLPADKSLPLNIPPKKPESSTTPPGGNNPSLPGFDPAVQGKIGPFSTNPTTNIGKETANSNLDLLGLIRETQDPMAATQATNWERMQLASETAQRSAMEKSQELTARQTELENIRAWRDITQSKITTNAAIAAANAAAMTAAQRPDAGYMNAASQLFQAAAAPYARAAARVG